MPAFRRGAPPLVLPASGALPPNVGRDLNGGYYDLDSGLPVAVALPGQAAPDGPAGIGPGLPSSMASVMAGTELPYPGDPRGVVAGVAAASEEDPLSAFAKRKLSKKERKKLKKKEKKQAKLAASRRGLLHNPHAAQLITENDFTTESGEVIKFNEAYRKLSDAAIAKASGALGQLYRASSQERSTGLKIGERGEVRLAKDELDDDEQAIMTTDSSSADESGFESSSDEDIWRGRRRRVRSLLANGEEGQDDDEEEEEEEDDDDDGDGDDAARERRKKEKLRKKEEKREARSLLEAADQERKQVTYKYRSLLDGLPDPTKPKARAGSGGGGAGHAGLGTHGGSRIHPATSFDSQGASAPNSALATPVGSEDEAEFSDIKKAQNLSIYLSPPDTSVPNRVIQTIVRGEWSAVMQELEEAAAAATPIGGASSGTGKKKLRTYLVATDLSEEAEYALEWTFGTIARDGDTIYVMYAVDEELATKANAAGAAGVAALDGELRDGKHVVADIAAVVLGIEHCNYCSSTRNA
ncbi:hypothetical protein KEM52_003396 [Ascosphaera acerosa]|nr:hypothetical protein KEM52_003396 [Ascosphaera acerosa]